MRTLYPEGHDVFASGLTYSEDAREFEDRQRTLAFVGSEYGVVSGLNVTDVSIPGNCRIEVSPGLAIDAQGYRVVLDAATIVSGLTVADMGKFVTVQKSNVDIFSTAHPITGAAAYTREIDGASVTVSGSCASGLGCVNLACISTVIEGGIPDVSLSTTAGSCRKTLMIDAVRLGLGGNVSEHRLSAHADGLSGGTGSLIPTIFDSTTDYITFTAMQENNWLSINGTLIGTDEANPVDDVMFVGGVEGEASGSWNIYMDSSAQTGKTQSALASSQFLLATVDFATMTGELTNLVDRRIFYEMTQDLVRADLTEAQTNDSLTESSTLKNNMNRMRYRLNVLETTGGGAYPIVANSGGDYNGATHTIFSTAIAAMPASGGTLVLADGQWIFGSAVNVTKPIHFFGAGHSSLVINNTTPTTFFNVLSSGVVFEGIDFSISVVSGGPYYAIDMVDQPGLMVKDCQFFAESAGVSFTGDFVRVAGGSNIRVEENYFHSDTATQIYLTEVIPSGINITSGVSIANNIVEGKGCGCLFRLDSDAYAQGVVIANNIGNVGCYPYTGSRRWITTTFTAIADSVVVVGNSFYNYATGIASWDVPMFASMAHIGGTTIVGNTAKFSLPAITHPYAISIVNLSKGVVQGNIIYDAYYGIDLYGHECNTFGNLLYATSYQGIGVNGDDNTVVGNMIHGTGDVGIYIANGADNNLIASNNIKGFASGIVDLGTGTLLSGTTWNQVS